MMPLALPFVIAMLMQSAGTATAQTVPLTCFGNEPFWRLELSRTGEGQFITPDSEPMIFVETSAERGHGGERMWRGRARGSSGDLVAFLRESNCSDGMSDADHPFTARLSLPDGRYLEGCCRLTTAAQPSAPAGLDGGWRLVAMGGLESLPLGKTRRPVRVRFASGRVSGFSGCNQFSGTYKAEGERLDLQPLIGTMMACPDPAMSIEQRFRRRFAGSLTFIVDGPRLTLTARGGGTLLFERDPKP